MCIGAINGDHSHHGPLATLLYDWTGYVIRFYGAVIKNVFPTHKFHPFGKETTTPYPTHPFNYARQQLESPRCSAHRHTDRTHRKSRPIFTDHIDAL